MGFHCLTYHSQCSPLLAAMLQYLPSLISISVAASMSLASYEIFDSFDEVNPASSEISRISVEPRNRTSPTTRRTTSEMPTGTDLPTELAEVDLTEVAAPDWLPNARNSSDWSPDSSMPANEYLNITHGLQNITKAATEELRNATMAVTEGLRISNMTGSDVLFRTSTRTTERALTVTVGYSRRKINPESSENYTTAAPLSNLTVPPDTCPEEEKPSNIGPYEVPTQKDLVLHVRRILLHMFRSYHKKTLEVLKDMKEATKSSWPKEEGCQGASKVAYRRCVRTVSNRCELAAKSLVLALEELRGDVLSLLQGKVCNIEDMNADPIQLIRILAMEKVSLEFALPGFLRLLNACAGHCSKLDPSEHSRKPLRRMMSDQDLVIRHFLTQKSYSRLLKGTA